MLKIRMQRIGRRHDPHFRIIVTDARRGPKSGNFIEIIGSYNAKMGEVQIKEDRATYWLSQGAQASDTVHNFLVDKGVVEGKKVNALPKKTPIVKEEPQQEEKPAEAPESSEEAPEVPADETPEEKKEEEPQEPETKEEEQKEESADEPAGAEEDKKEEEVVEETTEEDKPAEESEEESGE